MGDGAAGATLPDTSYGLGTDIRCDGDGDHEQGLLRFGSILGHVPGRIPPGATIQQAIQWRDGDIVVSVGP